MTTVDSPEPQWPAQGEPMSGKRSTEAFKVATVKQGSHGCHPAREVITLVGPSSPLG